jgi:C-terminal processing protease CtpA/Prc
MEDKNLEFGTLDGIAKLRLQLADLQAQLAEINAKLPPPLPPRICGVGMLLEAHDGQEELSVTKLVPGSPAQLCGLIQIHDVLYKVQETEVSGWDLDEVCNLIKGVAHYIWCCISA